MLTSPVSQVIFFFLAISLNCSISTGGVLHFDSVLSLKKSTLVSCFLSSPEYKWYFLFVNLSSYDFKAPSSPEWFPINDSGGKGRLFFGGLCWSVIVRKKQRRHCVVHQDLVEQVWVEKPELNSWSTHWPFRIALFVRIVMWANWVCVCVCVCPQMLAFNCIKINKKTSQSFNLLFLPASFSAEII